MAAPPATPRPSRSIFDPATVSYRQLLDTFWHIHNPTTLNRQGWDLGSQYRSAIFFHDPEQERLAVATREAEQESLVKPIVTEIVPAATFYRAEDYHQRYFERSGYAACGVTIEVRRPAESGRSSGRLLEPEVRLEQGAELHPPAMQAALERRLPDAGHRRGLLGREPFEVAQDDGRAQVGGQLRQRPLEHLLELAVECVGLGAGADRGRQRGDRVVVAGLAERRRRRAPGEPPLGLVERDPVEPGGELERSSNRARPRQARRKTSCATSSASCGSSPNRRRAP